MRDVLSLVCFVIGLREVSGGSLIQGRRFPWVEIKLVSA